ncbi:hypothetical protein L1987_82086 [Smallanthus sonchifolius]|uniref:Uncharacterized protein n=1 Tax=Smallanthus sonchifolius TaxID=185202 RepID=A0ACB8YTV1_9ASTR|nr:hypothetical protein L1987_82086 [Smallanthus sonchifolius]
MLAHWASYVMVFGSWVSPIKRLAIGRVLTNCFLFVTYEIIRSLCDVFQYVFIDYLLGLQFDIIRFREIEGYGFVYIFLDMMTTAILNYVQSLWPFAKKIIDDDLRVSDKLVSGLEIPDETKRFVFAFREPESQAVIYILCVQNLSERSAVDAERLVRCVKPGVVVAQVKEVEFDDFELVGHNSFDDDEHSIPTSSLQVLKRCFLRKFGKEKYENVAGSLVLKEIFGVGFNGHLSAAKRTAEEVGSSFLVLESPFVNIESDRDPSNEVESGTSQGFSLQPVNNLTPQKASSVIPSGSSRYFISDDYLRSPILKSSISHLIQLSSDQNTGPVNIQPKDDYEAPQYARSVYPLLEDLYNIFIEIPSLGRALAYARQ